MAAISVVANKFQSLRSLGQFATTRNDVDKNNIPESSVKASFSVDADSDLVRHVQDAFRDKRCT